MPLTALLALWDTMILMEQLRVQQMSKAVVGEVG